MIPYISKLVRGQDLTEAEAAEAMSVVMSGEATPAQIAGFMVALRMKGETAEEITGLARTMRAKAVPIDVSGDLLDTCGTGGDGSGTFNISTVSAIVAAGAGARVAKHGNRASSSRCGSADVLEALGVRIDLPPEGVARCIDSVGIGFLFAQTFHPSYKHAAAPRRELGIRTVFNLLGPLSNPAGARFQSVGVAEASMLERVLDVLLALGAERVVVFHGSGGQDELTISGPSLVAESIDGRRAAYQVDPAEVGLSHAQPETVLGEGPAENAAIVKEVLGGVQGPRRDVVLLNSAAALRAAGLADDWRSAVALAAETIDRGRAGAALERWVTATKAEAVA